MAVKASADHSKPIKILMTADAVGGVWQYSVDLLRGLGESAEVVLATLGPRPSAEQKQQLQNTRVHLQESDYSLEWMNDPWAHVDAAGEWLLSLRTKFEPDIIHLNGYAHAALPWRAPVVVVAHSCVYSWWRAVHRCPPSPEWVEYYRRVTNGLSACNAIVAPSLFMASEVEREYAVLAKKIHVIHNFSNVPVSAVKKKEPFALAAGRLWDQAKNLSLLTEVAPHLHWPLYLAGEEASADIPDSLQVLGQLPHAELIEYMSRASIFLHPALYEPFGLVVLEAARSGCCLLLADIPSFRELWSDCAIFLDGRKPESWIRKINQLAENPDECLHWGEAARKNSARYSQKESINAYQNIYRSLQTSAV